MLYISLASVTLIGIGFIVLHFALSHRTTELKLAGWVLVVGGILHLFGAFYFAPPETPARNEMVMQSWPGKPYQCKGKHHEFGQSIAPLDKPKGKTDEAGQ